MLNAVVDNETGELMEYRNQMKKTKYLKLYGNSYAMPGQVTGTNTIFFINKASVPADHWQNVTYGRVVVNYRPEKDNPYCTHITVGGNHINYPWDCGTPNVNRSTVKYMLNSVVSTPNTKFMTIESIISTYALL